ncbi:MAG: molybdopterin converting factor subunit 1 [Deltaproteobacteria bacterium]|nr:molybdopterin converting factor subunit 1 [Deltaproteobacteria bacterium]
MEINVLFFAVFRERLGKSEQALELPDGATVATAIAALESEHPSIAELRGRYRVAVNQEMITGDPPLEAGDELVLIPPVAGGQRHVRVLAEPLSLDRVVAAVRSKGTGGLVTFTGTVRDHSQGRAVERLEYEAYEPMAMKVISAVMGEIEAEIPGIRLAVEHRVGKLQIGDLAVVIACGAAHRAQAFQGCRAMIDRLKDRAPIWKKEIGPDGDEWVGLGP